MSQPGPTPYQRISGELVEAGASAPVAEEIVRILREAGLNAGQMRVWLMNRSRANPVWTPVCPWQLIPVEAIQQGLSEIVLAEARRFAAATPDHRRLARAFGCDTDSVHRLTGDDPARAATMVGIVQVLEETFSAAKIREVLYIHPPGNRPVDEPRMLDEMYAGNEDALLQRLRDRRIDLQRLFSDGLLHLSYIPGGPRRNPFLAEV